MFLVRAALMDLRVAHLWIVCPASASYPLDDRLSVVPIHQVPQLLAADWPKE